LLKAYTIGYFYVNIAEVRPEEDKLVRFVAIDPTYKFAYAVPHEKAKWQTDSGYLFVQSNGGLRGCKSAQPALFCARRGVEIVLVEPGSVWHTK
jgi:hypothetical protein